MAKTITSTTNITGNQEQKVAHQNQTTTPAQDKIVATTVDTWAKVLSAITTPDENKEKIEMRPVYIVYRDNWLFQTIVPKIIEDMNTIGRKVIIMKLIK